MNQIPGPTVNAVLALITPYLPSLTARKISNALAAAAAQKEPPQPADRELVDVAEAARLLSVSRASIYRMFQANSLPSRIIGKRCRRVPVAALRRLAGVR